ncbi:hypothetical protein J6590_097707 [Homalodisca vitripennis]|nr:hypothetical protein J6590_055201 [Homalodisca vitripennis]KAG8334098.1 hypothetical protein J6590_097707 [Homalodisca vitripennis]
MERPEFALITPECIVGLGHISGLTLLPLYNTGAGLITAITVHALTYTTNKNLHPVLYTMSRIRQPLTVGWTVARAVLRNTIARVCTNTTMTEKAASVIRRRGRSDYNRQSLRLVGLLVGQE